MVRYSVIIPLYNKERHIARAIYSVLAQQIEDFELLVVDDGSTDSGLDVVESIKDDRIRIIKQSNAGVSSARNKGVSSANGNYIVLLDADDAWESNHLSSFEKMISLYPDAGIYTTAYKIVKENKCIVEPWKAKIAGHKEIEKIQYFKESCMDGFLPVHTSAVCIPKKIFNLLGGFVVGQHLGEDLDMWGRIALKYDVIFNSVSSSIYYKDSDNRSTERQPPDELPFVSFYKKLAAENKISDDVYIKEYVVRQQFIIISKLIKSGNKEHARKILSSVDTSMQRQKLLKCYLSSYMPLFIVRIVLSIKRFLSRY